MNKTEYKPSEIEAKWPLAVARGKQVYDHKVIEKKWQERWAKAGIYEPDVNKAPVDKAQGKHGEPFDTTQGKPFYNLMMFPYPSAEGLHVGNMYAFCGSDIYGRYQRMKGNDVFEPIGLDGFGIHSENFALKIGEHPMELAKRTEANFYRQLSLMGNGYAWDHKLETYDPCYYKWTQWIFVQLFKHGLAYRAKAPVNWCPHCLTVLADEQAIKKGPNDKDEGLSVCERCGTQVERKELSQWFFRITSYAQRLLDNLEKLDWSEKVKLAQRNWIGKSDGAKVMFHCDIQDDSLIEVFTTRPDTIYGVTFLVLAPEHPLVTRIINKANGALQQEIRQYVDYSLKKTEDERLETKIEAKNRVKTEVLQGKSGVFSGFYATNPFSKKKVPIYIADYVLMSYGTGAVMGVPAHDQRDWEFAKKYKLEIVQVIESGGSQKSDISRGAFTEEGKLVNSGQFTGLTTKEGIQSITKYISEHQIGTKFATWHLRDWIISRQRYWGPPIPMIYCEKCAKERKSWFTRAFNKSNKTNLTDKTNYLGWDHFGWYPVEEDDLPVTLPFIKNFKPTGSGVSPLAQDKDFVKVKCPGCGAQARRETDVSDTFLDSAWYFLRYPSVHEEGPVGENTPGLGHSLSRDQRSEVSLHEVRVNQNPEISTSKVTSPRIKQAAIRKLPWDLEITKKWLPVDMYIGGAEHAVLHLLYSRFLTMALFDLGLVGFEEPFVKFRVNGLLIKDGAKMSKSKGNVVIPDGYIRKFGADTLRCYLMFCGRFTQGGDFRDTGMEGMHRFLKRVWRLVELAGPASKSAHSLGNSLGRDQRLMGDLHKAGVNQNPEIAQAQASSLGVLDQEALRMMHKTIKRVTDDIESLDYNTAIAALMEWVNFLEKKVEVKSDKSEVISQNKIKDNEALTMNEVENLLLLLAPFAPHMTEELWQTVHGSWLMVPGEENSENDELQAKRAINWSIHTHPWPSYDESKMKLEKVILAVQVDGKFRGKAEVDRGISASDAQLLVTSMDQVAKHIGGRKYKVIYVADKVINFVTIGSS